MALTKDRATSPILRSEISLPNVLWTETSYCKRFQKRAVALVANDLILKSALLPERRAISSEILPYERRLARQMLSQTPLESISSTRCAAYVQHDLLFSDYIDSLGSWSSNFAISWRKTHFVLPNKRAQQITHLYTFASHCILLADTHRSDSKARQINDVHRNTCAPSSYTPSSRVTAASPSSEQ